jgi:hypothetical protein
VNILDGNGHSPEFGRELAVREALLSVWSHQAQREDERHGVPQLRLGNLLDHQASVQKGVEQLGQGNMRMPIRLRRPW